MDEAELRRIAAEAQERLDALSGKPSGTRIITCETCGAITGIVSLDPDGGGTDASEFHAEWHARIEAALASIFGRLDGMKPGG